MARVARIERQMLITGEVGPLKTASSRRTVDLPANLVHAMQEWRSRHSEDVWILGIGPDQAHYGRDLIRKALYRACDRAGVQRLRIHDLRHAYASMHLSRGHSLKYVQEQLGHSSVKLTADTYGSHMPRRDPAAADDLAEALRPAPMPEPSIPSKVLPFGREASRLAHFRK